MPRRNRDAFGAVNRRATTHGDQAIAVAGFERRHPCAHGRLGRVGGRLIKHGHRHARQVVQRLLQDASSLHARIGHDQRSCDTDSLALLFQ